MIAQCLNGPVTVGDIVQIVMPTACCGARGSLGTQFPVGDIRLGVHVCERCGAKGVGLLLIECDYEGALPHTVIRIDPLPRSVDTETDAEVPA